MDHNTFEDSYDEIEEKLKQICDGGITEDDYKNENEKKLKIKNQKEDEIEEKMDTNTEYTNDDHKVVSSKKNEVGHILTEKEENVEIIFGTESGDEKSSMSQNISKINKKRT